MTNCAGRAEVSARYVGLHAEADQPRLPCASWTNPPHDDLRSGVAVSACSLGWGLEYVVRGGTQGDERRR